MVRSAALKPRFPVRFPAVASQLRPGARPRPGGRTAKKPGPRATDPTTNIKDLHRGTWLKLRSKVFSKVITICPMAWTKEMIEQDYLRKNPVPPPSLEDLAFAEKLRTEGAQDFLEGLAQTAKAIETKDKAASKEKAKVKRKAKRAKKREDKEERRRLKPKRIKKCAARSSEYEAAKKQRQRRRWPEERRKKHNEQRMALANLAATDRREAKARLRSERAKQAEAEKKKKEQKKRARARAAENKEKAAEQKRQEKKEARRQKIKNWRSPSEGAKAALRW